MSNGMMAFLEMSLIFGAVIGWGVWELYKLKKGR
jgi:hypothetical protein